MDSVSSLLGGSAAPQVIEHEGRTYKAGALTQKKKTEIERALVARAKSFCTSDAERAGVVRDAATGKYAFWGSLGQEFRETADGMVSMVQALFSLKTEEEAELLLFAKPEEVTAIVDIALLESLPRERRAEVIARRKDEKKKAEASEEAPFPPAE